MAWSGIARRDMPADDTSLTESLLRRDRWVVRGGLAGLVLLAWAYLLAGAGMGMSVREMITFTLFPHRLVEMPMEGMPMAPGARTPGYPIIVLLMWWVMMIAMMTPSASPTILLYARATRHAQAQGQLPQGMVPTAAFAGGYLLAWLGFSAAATLLMWLLEAAGAISAMGMSSMSAWLSATILIAAGLYQLSPLKHVCLQHCRSPAEFLSRRWRPGASGALRMGLEHGAYCVGCCWVLMALLFVGGVMNVLWVGLLALVVVLEKLAPGGPTIARIGGAVLLTWGAVTLAV
jgi:predicted metal-binding membrane protein